MWYYLQEFRDWELKFCVSFLSYNKRASLIESLNPYTRYKKIQLWKPTHHNKRFDIFRSSHEDIEPTQSCWTELTDRKLWSSGDIPTVDRVEATRNRPILSNDNDCLQQHLKFKDIAINFFDICRRYKEHHV